MKFQSLGQLWENLQSKEVFHHEIKGKRLKKEIKSLQDMEYENFRFDHFQITDLAIFLHMIVPIEKKEIQLAFRIDYEYPFNPPQLFYTGKQYRNLGYCKDLLKILLKQQAWGPSLTLTTFLDKIEYVGKAIVKKVQIPPKYHNSLEYSKTQLQRFGLKLIEAEEYEWKFWIKNTKKRAISLTDDTFLVFDPVSDQVFRLTFWLPITQFTQVKAEKGKNKFQLSMNYLENENKPVKVYYGGDKQALDPILQKINPIEMVERKINKLQKSGIVNHEQAIKDYTTLIEHYSTRNPELFNKYMEAMKAVIQQQYSEGKGSNEKQMREEIQA